jgi:hypothetical protein
MSGVIYSKQLANLAFTGSTVAIVYTVPAATTVVVTDIDYFSAGDLVGESSLVVLKNAAVSFSITAATGPFNKQWSGRQVLVAGDTIEFVCNSAQSTLAITGYVLGP